MAEFFSYDPTNGVRKMWDYDEMAGKAHFRHEQDVEPLLRYTNEMRNTGLRDRAFKELKHYAELPAVVQIELRNKGIDIFSKDPQMIKRMLREIDTNYPYLKVTEKRHGG